MKLTKTILIGLFLAAGITTTYADPMPLEVPQTIVVGQPQVRVEQGRIEITIPGDETRQVSIYALTGQVVKTFTAVPGVTTVELPAGYYIVKCDRVSCRVVVR